MMVTDVLLYRAHFLDEVVVREFTSFRRVLPSFDHFIVGYSDKNNQEVPSTINSDLIYLASRENLQTLPYTHRSPQASRPGPDLLGDDPPILWFFRQHDAYQRYWCVEYDVRYSGHWENLFSELGKSNADLLATNIYDENDLGEWPHWSTLKWVGRSIPKTLRTKAFLPFCRLSRQALLEIDFACTNGLDGHYETTWPTVCRHRGLVIEDIGGDGPYTPPTRRGRFYTSSPRESSLSPGTFVFRPAISDVEFQEVDRAESLLWHPVKPH